MSFSEQGSTCGKPKLRVQAGYHIRLLQVSHSVNSRCLLWYYSYDYDRDMQVPLYKLQIRFSAVTYTHQLFCPENKSILQLFNASISLQHTLGPLYCSITLQ